MLPWVSMHFYTRNSLTIRLFNFTNIVLFYLNTNFETVLLSISPVTLGLISLLLPINRKTKKVCKPQLQ